jgi:Flp pilus assembly protein TadD
MDTTKDKAQAEPHVDAALQAHLKAIDLDPTSFFDRNQVESRISRYIEFGKTDPIVERYKAAVQKDPTNAQYWSLLGYIYSRTNNLNAAIDAYKQASTLAPTDWSTLKNLAVMYQQAGKLDLAIQQAQQALRYAPQDQRQSLQDYIAQLQAGKK